MDLLLLDSVIEYICLVVMLVIFIAIFCERQCSGKLDGTFHKRRKQGKLSCYIKYFVILVCLLLIISPVSAVYHGEFLTCPNYLREFTLFALMTDFDKAAYWFAFRSIIMFRSFMQLDSVCGVTIPDVPQVFSWFLRQLKRDAICKTQGGTVENIYITRQIMERCQSVVRELCPSGKDPIVFLKESFTYQFLLWYSNICFKSFKSNHIQRVALGEFEDDDNEIPLNLNFLFPNY